MHGLFVCAAAAAFTIATNIASLAAMKEVPYPLVKLQLDQAYEPDAAFAKMQKTFADAVAKKDAQALFALVGPTFVWTSQGELNEQLDFGRDALHNFKVVFGFREFGKDADGAVADGPNWATLAAFAADKFFYTATGTLVCGPTGATVADDAVFDTAKQKIGADDAVEWYFTVADTTATAAPTGPGSSVGRVSQIALPVMNVYPPSAEGQPGLPATHLQVLLPSGKSGWIPAAAAVPLVTDRLCYAVTPDGNWKIAGFDQAQ
jgi:hypothetical protein